MAGFTDAHEATILNHVCNDPAETPEPVKCGLSTTTPTDDGNNFTNPTVGGYAEQNVDPGDWDAATGTTTKANGNAISFPQATSGSSILTHFGLKKQTANTLIIFDALDANRTVNNGDDYSFAAGALVLTLD